MTEREYMKQIKVIRVNDGNPNTLHNGNRLFIEEFETMESIINEYLSDGWEIIHVSNDCDPAIQEEGNYTFYKGGMTFVLQK